jgi:hypothetical protein
MAGLPQKVGCSPNFTIPKVLFCSKNSDPHIGLLGCQDDLDARPFPLGVMGGPLEAFEVIHALLLIYRSIIEDQITNAMGTEEPQANFLKVPSIGRINLL